jgi:D-alanyl-D-alanine carboxypeptidase
MDPWLRCALDYVPDWLGLQFDGSQQPGCIIAIAHRGQIVAEHAFGHANLDGGERLTPRHRFRIASHSKAFLAAGIMRLRELRRLKLDDAVGDFVKDLHQEVAQTTIAQLLSHSAGLIRDGRDSGQFTDGRPYLETEELLAELRQNTAIAPNTRFKYSNHGYGLLGLVIEAIANEPYPVWIRREIIDAAGLCETTPDMPHPAKGILFARGHSRTLPLGRRVVIPGDNPTHAITPAAGFVATAADTARFFGQLAPSAKKSVLSVASRREMTRQHWKIPQQIEEAYYGFGLSSGRTADWDWFGHGGGFQGYISRTCVIPACELAVTILTNAIDGWAPAWINGVLYILQTFSARGQPQRRVRDWRGRWWSLWGAVDLVPLGNQVLVANPNLINPFLDAAEIEVTGRDVGRISSATGYGSHGEGVRRTRSKAGSVADIWLGGINLKTEKQIVAEMQRRYLPGKKR